MSGVPLFDAHNLEDQIEAALQQKVPLKSGGYLIIDQTEAMTTVDVNTGAFVGRKDLEDTIYRTNLEAAAVIPRQLRLRNMGGIVIIDFIDMLNEEHKRQVAAANEAAAKLPDAPAAAPAAASASASYSSESSEAGTLAADESLAALRDKLKSAE